jgi:hypothetical protein
MSGTTTNFGWSYPTGGDVANVASDDQTTYSAIDASLGNALTTWTPVWSATGTAPAIGNGTITGRYKTFGKWGIATMTMTLGGTSAVGTLLYRWTLPPGWTLLSTAPVVGSGYAYDSSATTTYDGSVWAVTTTTVELRTHAATTPMSATVPFTPATGDIVNLLLRAELA